MYVWHVPLQQPLQPLELQELSYHRMCVVSDHVEEATSITALMIGINLYNLLRCLQRWLSILLHMSDHS